MAVVTAEQAAPVDMMSGKSMMSDEASESAGFSIEIAVDGQGNLSVSLESAGQEAAESAGQATPAQSIDEALKIAKEMYAAESGAGANPQAMWNQEAATRGPATATA